MTENKQVVERYIAGFNTGNNQLILSCLTPDVIWYMPGYFYHHGIDAFAGEINNENFEGLPVIHITRMIEENDIVVAEGTVQCKIKNGGILDALFCDVFFMEGGRIKRLNTYQMNK